MSNDDAPAHVDVEAIRRELAAESRIFKAIGRFIYQFSQLEFTMKAFLAAQIGIKEEHFDAVTAPYDFHILSVVTQTISLMRFPDQKKSIDDLFNRCRELNIDRNRVAHGMWSGKMSGGLVARHVARSSLKASYYFENPDDLEKLADTAQRLMAEFLFVLGIPPDAKGAATGVTNTTGDFA